MKNQFIAHENSHPVSKHFCASLKMLTMLFIFDSWKQEEIISCQVGAAKRKIQLINRSSA